MLNPCFHLQFKRNIAVFSPHLNSIMEYYTFRGSLQEILANIPWQEFIYPLSHHTKGI